MFPRRRRAARTLTSPCATCSTDRAPPGSEGVGCGWDRSRQRSLIAEIQQSEDHLSSQTSCIRPKLPLEREQRFTMRTDSSPSTTLGRLPALCKRAPNLRASGGPLPRKTQSDFCVQDSGGGTGLLVNARRPGVILSVRRRGWYAGCRRRGPAAIREPARARERFPAVPARPPRRFWTMSADPDIHG
jgi:hypothetical protein